MPVRLSSRPHSFAVPTAPLSQAGPFVLSTTFQKEAPKIATKNSRNAALLLSPTLGGAYTQITKSHGLKLNLGTDFSEDTGHGARFKSYLPGLQDFKGTVMAWYDTAYTTLEAMSLNKISEYFLAYPDLSDPTNYYRGQCFMGLDEVDMDLGNTVGMSYTMTIANADIAVIRGGAAL